MATRLILLTTKLLLVPMLIAAITIAGQRLGPRIAGALTGLPVVAGPIVLFIAIEQGVAFAARSSVASLAGQMSLAAFCVLYAAAALRSPWWVSMAIAWGGFALGTLVLRRFEIPLAMAVLLALATPVVIRRLTPRPHLPARVPRVSAFEIALRMAAGVALVVVLTGAADLLGPQLSGLLTVFPVAATVLAVFSHRNQGAPFTVHLIRGLAAGLYSLTAFFLTLTLALERLGIPWAFLAAVLASLLAQLAVLQALNRRQLRASPVP